MPPYRFYVRTSRTADNQLADLYLKNPRLRNAIARASHDMDRILGMGPPNQGAPRPLPGYPHGRDISVGVLRVGFHYDANGVEVVVTSFELNPLPPHGFP
jgi:hypothetical protein